MKRLIYVMGLFSTMLLIADIGVTPTYVARSAGQNRVLLDVGSFWNGVNEYISSQGTIDQKYIPHWFGYLGIIPGFSRSFDQDMIRKSLFGSDICDGVVKVQGSNIVNRDPQAWLADYMYLSPDFNGGFSINPLIENAFIEIDFYLSLEKLIKGMYLRINGPFNWTKWDPQFCELAVRGTVGAGYTEGYFAPDAVSLDTLNSSITTYMAGYSPTITGITAYGLNFARFGCNEKTKSGFADLHLELGWNCIEDDYRHLGISIQAVLPTGTKHNADFALNPMIGNGNHWELGGGLTAHYLFWQSKDEEKMAMIYFDVSLTHLFNAYENRTFDIVDKPNSRYMLAQKVTTIIQDNLTTDSVSAATSLSSTPPHYQFDAIYSPVANLTTASLKIGSAVQVDFVALLNLSIYNIDLQIGYNLWARSADRIANNREDCAPLSIFNEENEYVWALKGDAHMYGYATVTGGGLTVNDPIPLSATEGAATIHNGTNNLVPPIALNNDVDTAQYAYGGSNNQRLNYARGLANIAANQVQTSALPELLHFSTINLQTTRGLSNKLFAHLNYLWTNNNHVHPFIGIGCSAEIGLNKTYTVCPQLTETDFINICDNGPITASLSQWSVWLKAGFLFD